MIYLAMFWEFFKTGLFAVGGGMATLPFLSSMSQRTGWFTQAQLADMVAVSESTPGPIGVNMATYVGYILRGVPGAVVATLGLITPSILVILLIAAFLRSFQDNRFVKSVFRCLRPASVGLIAVAGLNMADLVLLNGAAVSLSALAGIRPSALVLFAALLVLTRFVKTTARWHPVVWIGISAGIGIVFHFAGV